MENLPTFKFRDRTPGESPEAYVQEFKRSVDESWNELRQRVNWVLERVHITTETAGVLDRDGTRSMVYELIPPKAIKNTDGNFRFRIIPNGAVYDLIIEVRESGVWITVATITPGGPLSVTTLINDTDSPYTVLARDEVLYCDTDGGAITVNLPSGINGKRYRIINTGSASNDVTISPSGAELLTGANASRTLSDSSVVILIYETTEGWW